MKLSSKANKIFNMKYSKEGEDWDKACWRIAEYVASAGKNFGLSGDDIVKDSVKFFQIMNDLYFLPGGRILANAGTTIKNMFNCFYLNVPDSREGIYQTLKDSAEIFALGGGIGYTFSNIREEGALIKGTGGKASGPLSFASLFDQTGEVIQQASRR